MIAFEVFIRSPLVSSVISARLHALDYVGGTIKQLDPPFVHVGI
jgi:hypothetical protein